MQLYFDFWERKPRVGTLIPCGIVKRLVSKRAEVLEDSSEYRIICCLLIFRGSPKCVPLYLPIS